MAATELIKLLKAGHDEFIAPLDGYDDEGEKIKRPPRVTAPVKLSDYQR